MDTFMNDMRIGQNCVLEFLPKGRPSILKLNFIIILLVILFICFNK